MKLFLLIVLLVSQPLSAATYVAINESGVVDVTAERKNANYRLFDPLRPYPPRAATDIPRHTQPAKPASTSGIRSLISRAAGRSHVDPRLIHAVVQVESAYDARAVSHSGAIGLMQIMPQTGRRFGAVDLFDPLQNLQAGAAYLQWLMGQFDGDISLVLAAYNAGENAVIRHGHTVPPYPETIDYVDRVLARYHRDF